MPFRLTVSKAEVQDAVKSALDAQGYTSDRASKLDNLDVPVSSRAAPGDILVDPSVKIDASKINNNLDAPVSSRLDLASLRSELDNRGLTSSRMAKLDSLFAPVSKFASIAASDNTRGLEVTLDTGYRSVVEIVYSCGSACTVEVYGSDDGSNWVLADTISESAAVSNKVVGYLNARRYVKVRIPTTGIDASITVIAV